MLSQPVENPQTLLWAEAAFPSPGRGNGKVASWKAGEKEVGQKASKPEQALSGGAETTSRSVPFLSKDCA